MDSITLENFISFCDDMQIAQEGFFSNIKEVIKKKLLKIINHIQTKMKQKKETKFKKLMISLLDRAKKLLGDVDIAQSQEEIKNIDNEAEQLKSEVENIDTDSDWNPKKDKKWNKVPDDIKKLILSNNVDAAREYILNSIKGIINTNPNNITIDQLNYVLKHIGAISYFYRDRLFTSMGTGQKTIYVSIDYGHKNLVGLYRLLTEDFNKSIYDSIKNQLFSIKTAINNKNSTTELDNDDLY